MPDLQTVVSAEEVGDGDTGVCRTQDVLGHRRTPRGINPVIGQPFGDEGPEPMPLAGDLPAGLVHVEGWTGPNRLDQFFRLDLEPPSHPLQGLGQPPFGDRQVPHVLEHRPDLVEGQAVDVLEQKGMHQDLRPEGAAGDLVRSRWSGDDLLASGAPVAMVPEASHLHPSRNQVFLDVLGHFHGLPQRGLASGALREGLIDHPVDVIRLGPGHTGMPRLLAGTFGASLQERGESVQARLLGRAELLNKMLDFVLKRGLFPIEVRHQRDQLFFGESSNFLAEVL